MNPIGQESARKNIPADLPAKDFTGYLEFGRVEELDEPRCESHSCKNSWQREKDRDLRLFVHERIAASVVIGNRGQSRIESIPIA